MSFDDIKMKLHALGSEGVLETLDCVSKLGWATASEVAKCMDTHIATAVKRLSMLHEAGFLDCRVRRGKTRSAQEYYLRSTRITLELDLNGDGNGPSDAVFLGALLRDILARLGRFGGRTEHDVLRQWKSVSGIDEKIIIWLEADTMDTSIKPEILLEAISKVLAAEATEYGELTVKALATASLDAVKAIQDIAHHDLPSRFFGGD